MKPEPLVIESGCYKICVTPMIEFLTKKPVVRIECIEDDTNAMDDEGYWIEEHESAMYTFSDVAELDKFISKLQEARIFIQPETT